jgi:RecB family exonuclease
MNGVEPERLARATGAGPDLARLARRIEAELAAARLADRALVFAAATDAVAGHGAPVGLPLLLLDVPVASAREAELLAALAARAPEVLATAPAGDEAGSARLETALRCTRETAPAPPPATALARLRTHLFADTAPPPCTLDDSVALCSWPGEARECVEIARGVRAAAARGVPFDRIAVFLRSPGEYRAHLEEAFRRADLPVFFARGSTRPDPAGRALLALLACAAERLSARRFAEYLSLAQVPDPGPPRPPRWVAPENDLLPAGDPGADDAAPAAPLPDPDAAVIEGTLRAPWRWEQLLVDAAVIGSRERWQRRLDGLAEELRRRRADVAGEDEAQAAVVERQLGDLTQLRAYALPLIARLADLPASAPWQTWLAQLVELAETTLREPEGVLATLAELAPMGPVGPVTLDEVQLVLAPRLRELAVRPPRRRYGHVFVAPAESARGLQFDVVFVPGLAEKLFPRRLVEDPILLDARRTELDVPFLVTQPARVAAERLALRLAVGAARERVVLSYPRVDVEQARPRVPSFYALEALRAAEGTLPGFEELGLRAGAASGARLGWPAPKEPQDAIDEAEYDLALLAPLLDADPETTTGTATYLLDEKTGANVHLARALRARARRWLRRWTPADGLVDPDAPGAAALARHRLDARSYSPTALQHFAVCPYRFVLHALHRLQPREEPVAVEVLDPLTRGALFHEVQFSVLTRLRDEGLLPVGAATLEAALAAVDAALDAAAAEWAEKLFPAIQRVWDDGINGVRADLREWLRRSAAASDGWVPHRFELSFGLAGRGRAQEDPASVAAPVPLPGGLRLRGSIDLVERHAGGRVRATDHKTGKVRARAGVVIGGGQVLQPVLYALACEQLLADPVDAGRLYYCTADGGFTERVVPLDDGSREAAALVVGTIGRALAEGFLPAAPAKDACRWCDYRPVCGPYEDIRTLRKPAERLADLERLRQTP